MISHPCKTNPRCAALCLFLTAILAAQAVIAGSDSRILKIDPNPVIGTTNMPDEMRAMFHALGYESQYLVDPESHLRVETTMQDEQFRMRFVPGHAPGIRVDVHIRILDNVTGLHIERTSDETPASVFEAEFDRIRERAEAEFGPKQVKESGWLFSP